jgi:glycerol-3-phosphate cytidylyltransferase
MGLTIYTGGTFDLLHRGHVNFLSRCAELGAVTVALNTDEFIYDYKGKKPVLSYDERAEVLLGLRSVERVIPNFAGKDSRPSIELVKPDIVAIGSDWARRNYYEQMGFTQDWLDERNISLLYIPYTSGISSTDVKRRLAVN